MTNDYGIYDRYSDEMQNLSLRAREHECGSMLKKERAFFGFTEESCARPKSCAAKRTSAALMKRDEELTRLALTACQQAVTMKTKTASRSLAEYRGAPRWRREGER